MTRGKRLTQLLLISLVVHNSGSPSLCPVNEDADVIELPTPPLLCTVGTPHALPHPPSPREPGFNAVAAFSPFLHNSTAVEWRRILHLLFPRRDGHCGKRRPRKLTFISVFQKDFALFVLGSRLRRSASDLCRSTVKRHYLALFKEKPQSVYLLSHPQYPSPQRVLKHINSKDVWTQFLCMKQLQKMLIK